MGTPLTDWGYCRRKCTRTETNDTSGTSYSGWSYSYPDRTIKPSSVKMGTHDYRRSSAGGGTTWTKYNISKLDDFPYIVFSLPTSHTGRTVTFTITNGDSGRTIYIRRITSPVSGNKIPANTTTHQKSVSVKAGTYTVDVSTLLDDLEANGNYGLMFYNEPTSSNTYRAMSISSLVFNWEDKSATTPTYSSQSVDLGSAVNITTANDDPSVLNTLTYQFGSFSGTIASDIGNTVTAWTPPLSWAESMPAAASGVCTITCRSTYNGEDIGSTITTIVLTVPTAVKCTISSVALTEAISSIASKFGAFVQGKSKITVNASVSTAGAYGATVSGYLISINGGQLNANGATTDFLKTAGANTCTVTITDSRGRTDSYTESFTVQAYSAPSVSIASAERDPDTPSSIIVDYSWSISPINGGNDKTIKIYADEVEIATITPGTYTGSGSYTITDTESSVTCEVKLSATDYFSSSSFSWIAPSAGSLDIDVGQDGSIGLGMEAQEDGALDIGLPTVFHDDVTGIPMSGVTGLTEALEAKIDEPDTEGNDGDALFTDGTGGRYWGPLKLPLDEIWKNESPTSSFASQFLAYDLTAYTGIYIVYQYMASTTGSSTVWIPKTGKAIQAFMRTTTQTSTNLRAAYCNDTGIQIGDGYSGTSSSNAACIPVFIYGLR